MNRTDTRPYLEEMLHSCAHPSADNHLTKEIQLCNGENLLIIERWTENKARAIRATPIEDAQLLMDFEFPLYKTDGSRLRYTSQTQDRLDMDLYNEGENDLDSDSDKYIPRLMEALSVIIEDSNERQRRVTRHLPQAHTVQVEEDLEREDSYACMNLQTIFISK